MRLKVKKIILLVTVPMEVTIFYCNLIHCAISILNILYYLTTTTMQTGEDLKRGKDAESSPSNSSDTSSSSSTFAPDLKEMFSLGPSNPLSGFPAREFPDRPVEFEPTWTAYYSTLETLAGNVLSAFALALGLPDERFFDQYLDHHASAIRYCTSHSYSSSSYLLSFIDILM